MHIDLVGLSVNFISTEKAMEPGCLPPLLSRLSFVLLLFPYQYQQRYSLGVMLMLTAMPLIFVYFKFGDGFSFHTTRLVLNSTAPVPLLPQPVK